MRETRLRWFGPRRRFMNMVREDMQGVNVTEEDAKDRLRWRKMICCGDP